MEPWPRPAVPPVMKIALPERAGMSRSGLKGMVELLTERE